MPSDPQFRPHPVRRRKTTHEEPPTVRLNRTPIRKLSLLDKLRLALQLRNLIRKNTMKKTSFLVTIAGVITGASPLLKGMLPDHWDWVGDACLTVGSLLLGWAAKGADESHSQSPLKHSEPVVK